MILSRFQRRWTTYSTAMTQRIDEQIRSLEEEIAHVEWGSEFRHLGTELMGIARTQMVPSTDLH